MVEYGLLTFVQFSYVSVLSWRIFYRDKGSLQHTRSGNVDARLSTSDLSTSGRCSALISIQQYYFRRVPALSSLPPTPTT